jgi:rhodanese-related sulfurtransferase
MVLPKTIKEMVIIVGISVIVALAVNTLSPRGIALVGQWNTAKGVITANPTAAVEGELQEIDSVALARELFDKGDVLFVDARSSDNYQDGHIQGAISLPMGQFDEGIASFLDRYSPDQPIVTYCSGRTCEDSHYLAQFLSDAGFTNVRIFIDGFPGWESEGHPIE